MRRSWRKEVVRLGGAVSVVGGILILLNASKIDRGFGGVEAQALGEPAAELLFGRGGTDTDGSRLVEELLDPSQLRDALAVDSFADDTSGPQHESKQTVGKVVLYYSLLCGHCLHFAPRYSRVAKKFIRKRLGGSSVVGSQNEQYTTKHSNNSNTFKYEDGNSAVEFFAFECSRNPNRRNECRSRQIRAFPTVRVYRRKTQGSTGGSDTADQTRLESFECPVTYLDEGQLEGWLRRRLVLPRGTSDDTAGTRHGDNGEQRAHQMSAFAFEESEMTSSFGGGSGGAHRSDLLVDALLGLLYLLRDWNLSNIATNSSSIHADTNSTPLLDLLAWSSLVIPGDNIKREIRNVMWFFHTGATNPTRPLAPAEIDRYIDGLTLGGIVKTSTPPVLCETSSCCVWRLFHLLTAATAQLNDNSRRRGGMQQYSEDLESLQQYSEDLESLHVADSSTVRSAMLTSFSKNQLPDACLCMNVIHGVVERIFSCRLCRTHFLNSYSTCDFGRCEWIKCQYDTAGDANRSSSDATGSNSLDTGEYDGLVLWMWRLHNGVNVRVAVWHAVEKYTLADRAASGDDLSAVSLSSAVHPFEARWPSSSVCPKCWNDSRVPSLLLQEGTELVLKASLVGHFRDSEVDMTDGFDLGEVCRFLKHFFYSWEGRQDPPDEEALVLGWDPSSERFKKMLRTSDGMSLMRQLMRKNSRSTNSSSPSSSFLLVFVFMAFSSFGVCFAARTLLRLRRRSGPGRRGARCRSFGDLLPSGLRSAID